MLLSIGHLTSLTKQEAAKSVRSGPPKLPVKEGQSLYWKLSEITGDLINVDELATPKQFRLIDCSAYCNRDILLVVHCSFDEFPYATISHVWNGRYRAHLDESFNIHPITGYRINIQSLTKRLSFCYDAGSDSHLGRPPLRNANVL